MDAHKNFAQSTLASPPSGTSGTSLTVATGHGTRFPAAPFNVTLWPAGVAPTVSNAEIVRVTAKATDVFTVTRAQESTSARTHSANDQIAATITARTLTDVEYGALDTINVKDPVYGAVGDGITNDSVALQAALDASGGKNVFLPAGTYQHASALTASVADTRFYGPGTLSYTGSGIALTISGARVVMDGIRMNTTGSSGTIAISVSGVDCDILGVRITGDATDGVENGRVDITNTAHRCRVSKCTFDGTFTSVAVAADWCQVTENTFLSYRLGVYLTPDASHTLVESNRFISIGGSGITAGYDAVLVEGSDNDSIHGNIISACREHGIYVAGHTTPNVGVSITGNAVAGHGSDGIKVLGANATDDAATDVTISGNTVTDGDSTSGGITLGFCKRVTVAGNVTTGQNRGIFVRGGCTAVQVIGNSACGNTGAGIEVRDLSAGNVGVLIADNQANENDTAAGGFPGIYVLCSGGFVNSDITIRGNKTYDFQGSPTQQQGIAIADVTGGSTLARLVIEDNVGSGNVGALVEGAGLADATGLTIRGNYDGSSTTVASAGTITLPLDAPRVTITGTTSITSVTATYSTMPVTLVFADALTFTDGSNLKLAGNFVTTADDTITIVCDGTNWYEVCRSVN